MGFLKKIFKPVSKVLDKVIPNEIKPALPYLAAFAPFIAPGIMGSSVLQRAAMGGGLNIFGQLSQEGNEGDINLLSAGLGALSGAMSAPGKSATVGQGVPGADFTGADFGFEVAANSPASVGTPSAGEFFKNLSKGAEGSGVMASGQRFLGDTLAKGSDMYVDKMTGRSKVKPSAATVGKDKHVSVENYAQKSADRHKMLMKQARSDMKNAKSHSDMIKHMNKYQAANKAYDRATRGQFDEISNAKMGQYVRKAADDAARKASKGDVVGARQRVKGVNKAMDKMDKNRLYGRQ